MWDPVGPETEPVSPKLANRFFTTEPPGQSWSHFHKASIPCKRASPSWLKHLPKALPTKLMGFPGGLVGKESSCNAGDTKDAGSFPGLGRTPGGGHGNPLQYSCLENPMDRRPWRASPQGPKESDMTEATEHICTILIPLHQSLGFWQLNFKGTFRA